MVTIETDGTLVTFVNVFTCWPENQDHLIQILEEETRSFAQHVPGFLSASIHRSLDGRRVVNYAQWTDVRAFEKAMQGEDGRRIIARVHPFAQVVDIHTYEVASVFETDST